MYPEETFIKKPSIYTCVNSYSYHLVRKNPHLYNQMDGLYIDGLLMAKAIGILWRRPIPRLSFDMTTMARDLFQLLNNSSKSIYFVGTKQEELEKSIANISNAYPNMHIAGYRNGYFSNDEERLRAIETIISINPDYVVVGMGSLLQEQFILDLKTNGYKGIAFTCGGFLHQTANDIYYYPDWINKYNLRAFYRLYKEKGLFRRLYNVLIEFPILFTWDSLMTKMRKKI